MSLIRKSANVPYTPQQMFQLVDGIEQYPAFLPWCKSTTVHARRLDEVEASIEISKGGIAYSVTTLNRLQQDKKIEVRLVKGPFSRLQGFWRFESVSAGGCCVSFEMEFAFANRFMDLTVGPILQTASGSFLEVFCQRAKVVYGS